MWWLGHSCESCFRISATDKQRETVKITLALRTVMYLQAAEEEAESDELPRLSMHRAERDSKMGNVNLSAGVTGTNSC